MRRRKVATSSAYDRITTAQGAQISKVIVSGDSHYQLGWNDSHQESFIVNRMVHFWHTERSIVFSTMLQ